MTAPTWQPSWLQSTAHRISASKAWRGVETQYASSTTQLVDSLDAQDLLEQMIEASKPPLPPSSTSKHFLLTTPFRYTPGHASRFRPLGRTGLWYGAKTLPPACAEVAYWRMRFIRDSAGLADQKIITSHTFFAAAVGGLGVNLTEAPWVDDRLVWTSDDYGGTHRLAAMAEETGIKVIQYESARAPGHVCLAVFTPEALREPAGGLDATRQKWSCTATRDYVMMVSDMNRSQRFEFKFSH